VTKNPASVRNALTSLVITEDGAWVSPPAGLLAEAPSPVTFESESFWDDDGE